LSWQLRPQWQEVELEFSAANDTNPYLEVEAWVEFVHDDGPKIKRQMFRDGGNVFRVRFASPEISGQWNWTSFSSSPDSGSIGITGTLTAVANSAKKTPFVGARKTVRALFSRRWRHIDSLDGCSPQL